ncbi:IS3 family transposase [Mycoplasma mycoides subsp. capri]|nr:IS3 family transposase [Mycoplasma mycoides subsp. capri]
MIVDIFNKSFETYGYRRLKIALKSKGHIVNHKKILRLTKELGVQCIKFRTKNRRYSSYKGTVGKIADNILKSQWSKVIFITNYWSLQWWNYFIFNSN